MQLVERLTVLADRTSGLAQYAVRKYAEAFEVIPRTLAESAGLDATEVLAKLYTAHHSNPSSTTTSSSKPKPKTNGTSTAKKESSSSDEEEVPCQGVDIENNDGTGTLDAEDEGILDLLITKSWAIKLATEAARTVLSVDQIIVARQAGGPKPPGPNANWDEDD